MTRAAPPRTSCRAAGAGRRRVVDESWFGAFGRRRQPGADARTRASPPPGRTRPTAVASAGAAAARSPRRLRAHLGAFIAARAAIGVALLVTLGVDRRVRPAAQPRSRRRSASPTRPWRSACGCCRAFAAAPRRRRSPSAEPAMGVDDRRRPGRSSPRCTRLPRLELQLRRAVRPAGADGRRADAARCSRSAPPPASRWLLLGTRLARRRSPAATRRR